MKKVLQKERDKCEDCKDKNNCRNGEEPCGSYELPESVVCDIYNGEYYD